MPDNRYPRMSPEWWRSELHWRLNKRRPILEKFDAYYEGRFPLPWLAPEAVHTFRRLLRLSRSNYMGLVCDALTERLLIEGFRIGNAEETDAETWRIWQASNMDSESDQLLLDAVIRGIAPVMVSPNAEERRLPIITVEDSTQVYVAYESGNRRKALAALKVFQDEWDEGRIFATLYLPEGIYKWQTEGRIRATTQTKDYRWEPREIDGETWPAPNLLGRVPIFEFINNPLRGNGRSEIYDCLEGQDRICKTLIDRLLTQDYGAFPQRWATGFPSENDEGEPQEVEIGRDRLVRSDVAETKFGQFESAPLDPYSAAKREDVRDIAARSRTPAQYLLGEFNNVNGETLKAAESGLVAKSRQRCRTFGETAEDVAQAGRELAGLKNVDGEGLPLVFETVWKNPEFRTEGELVDALIKMHTLRVPLEALWERWGASPTERTRWKQALAQEQSTPVTQALVEAVRARQAGATQPPALLPPQGP